MALVMVVDDEPDIVDLVENVLVRAGHTVHTAADGRQALAEIVRLRPDVCILDHYMPEVTGLEVAERLRSDPATASLKLIMLSAAAPPNALLYCNVVLAKPVPNKQLVEIVAELLRPGAPTDPLLDVNRLRAAGLLLDRHSAASGARLDGLSQGVSEQIESSAAAVNIVLVDAVAVCGAYGLSGWIREAGGMPAEWTPGTAVVRSAEPLLLDDLEDHPAYAASPLASVSGVRSYAGVPLTDRGGHTVGTLDVMDRKPHAFTAAVLDRLRERSADAVAALYS
jgi:CheY-like chemotaxis protein